MIRSIKKKFRSQFSKISVLLSHSSNMLISFRYSLLIALCLAYRVYARDDFSDSWYDLSFCVYLLSHRTSCSMVQSIDEKYTTGIDNTFYTSYAMNSFAVFVVIVCFLIE